MNATCVEGERDVGDDMAFGGRAEGGRERERKRMEGVISDGGKGIKEGREERRRERSVEEEGTEGEKMEGKI